MSLRFRKSVRLAPGVRLNLGKRGVSVSAGVRGATVTAGRGGLYGNVGLPGTGLSTRQRLSGSGRPSGNADQEVMNAVLALREDGTVEFLDSDRNPLPPRLVKLVREQNGEFIQSWLSDRCDEWNQGIDKILNIHVNTPDPMQPITFSPESFDVPEPIPLAPKPLGLLARIFKGRRERIDLENHQAADTYRAAHADWERQRDSHRETQEKRRKFMQEDRLSQPQAMQDFLEERFASIDWPRETLVSFEVESKGERVMIDVDLPETEDMPTEQATVASRGVRLNTRSRSETQRRREYMNHVHGIAFLLVGVTFASLPTVHKVVISGYSQRPDQETGQNSDDYLFSVRVGRDEWSQLNFDNLPTLDVPTCLGNFEMRRKMTKTGIFTPIEPFITAD